MQSLPWEDCLKLFRSEVESHPSSAASSASSTEGAEGYPAESSPVRKTPLSGKRCFSFMNSPRKRVRKSEVDENFVKALDSEESDPLKFWKKAESQFSKYAKLARHYLSIPATTGAIARARQARILFKEWTKRKKLGNQAKASKV